MTFAGLIILALGFSLITLASLPAISRQIRRLSDSTARQAITQSSNYKWWVLGTIGVGSFISVISHASVLVVLPTIAGHFQANLPAVQWVAIGEARTIAVLLLPMGRLSDIVGRKRVYIAGFVIFVLAAVLAGLATNLSVLIGAKALQGAGSAMVQATGMAMIISTFPGSERGKA